MARPHAITAASSHMALCIKAACRANRAMSYSALTDTLPAELLSTRIGLAVLSGVEGRSLEKTDWEREGDYSRHGIYSTHRYICV